MFLSDVHNTLIWSGFPMFQTLGKSQFVLKWKTCVTARSRRCGSLSFLWYDNVVHFWLKLPLLQHLVSLWQQSNFLVIENNACVMLAKWMGGYVSQKVIVQTEKKEEKSTSEFVLSKAFKQVLQRLVCIYYVTLVGNRREKINTVDTNDSRPRLGKCFCGWHWQHHYAADFKTNSVFSYFATSKAVLSYR